MYAAPDSTAAPQRSVTVVYLPPAYTFSGAVERQTYEPSTSPTGPWDREPSHALTRRSGFSPQPSAILSTLVVFRLLNWLIPGDHPRP
jgi:hypothetical protein